MELIPAIDLREGRCVRLLKGDFDRETRYETDPVELARQYRNAGAAWLHVVDLDGAKHGSPVNLELVARMRRASGLKIQFGGGVRTRANLDTALECVDRVVVGSLAVTHPPTVEGWLAEVGSDRITLGLDVRFNGDGRALIATHGWTQQSALGLDEAIERYRETELAHVLCTDIDRDGALAGPNVALYRDCVRRWPGLAFIASGGVRDAADLAALAATGVAAAVSGKALLEGLLTAEEMKPFLPAA
jgi:phosphoribosylformimino-5-aminoimidazole carboxamide ribotide isomerase